MGRPNRCLKGDVLRPKQCAKFGPKVGRGEEGGKGGKGITEKLNSNPDAAAVGARSSREVNGGASIRVEAAGKATSVWPRSNGGERGARNIRKGRERGERQVRRGREEGGEWDIGKGGKLIAGELNPNSDAVAVGVQPSCEVPI